MEMLSSFRGEKQMMADNGCDSKNRVSVLTSR